MARTIAAIQQSILDAITADPVLGELNSTSKVSNYRALAWVIAVAIWSVETAFDLLKDFINSLVATKKPHSTRWYAEKVKEFQYGYNLVDEADYYDNTGIDETLIEQSKIVAYSAVTELETGLRIKVAKNVGTDLGPLSNDELTALRAFVRRVKDAGVKFGNNYQNVTSGNPDSLKLELEVYYNPLVLKNDGGRLDGVDAEPVQNATKAYLKQLPFNGLFILQNLQDQLQKVDGVEIINIKNAQAKYGTLPFEGFGVKYLPDAGYLRIVNPGDLIITFIPFISE